MAGDHDLSQLRADLAAADKYPCPACGAQAEWNPAKQKLVCVFCGTEIHRELNRDSGQTQGMDLAAAVLALPSTPAASQDDKRSIKCRSCNAVSAFPAGRVGQRCGFCGSPELVSYLEMAAPVRPDRVLPFTVSESQVREHMREWYANRPFSRKAFARRAQVDTLTGVYVPCWAFTADAFCIWTSFVKGEGSRSSEFDTVAGTFHHVFHDVTVSASQGIRWSLLRAIEPWPVEELVPYDRAYVSGFIVEHYQKGPSESAALARGVMSDKLVELSVLDARRTYPDQRGVRIDPSYSDETVTLILVPVWLLSCTYQGQAFQVVVNGRTGKLEGDTPWSRWKVVLFLLFTLALLVLTFMAIRAIVAVTS